MENVHGGDIYRNRIDLDFSVNINPSGIPKSVKAALYKAVESCDKYPDIEAQALKEAVSSTLLIPQEQLLFGNGASELFMAAVHALRPKKTMILAPSFYGYEYAAKAVGSEVIYFFLKQENDFLPQEGLLEALSEKIDLLILGNPNNPTGKKLDQTYLRCLLEHCREKNITVVLDECFIEFCEGECSMISESKEYEHLLIVRAFTKIYAIPGVRLGYLIGSDPLLLEKIKRHLPEWNLSTFAQKAGIACVKERGYIEETIKYLKDEREYLIKELRAMGIMVFAGEADFILIYTKKPLYAYLLTQGILIRDCRNFKGLTEGYYRIAIKSHKDNQRLLKAIGECNE